MTTYQFDLADGSLQDSLRRIALAEIAPLCSHLDSAEPLDPKAVHDIRKRIKKLRALLRLTRSGLRRVQPAENVLLRDAARQLAAQRDAATRLKTFDMIAGDDPSPALGALRAQLVAEAAVATAPPPDLGELFASLSLRVENWELSGSDRSILTTGLADTRERARQAMREARDSGGAEALHDWRKRAKDFWYQARLFQPVWRDVMRPFVTSADMLGEMLGQHHDFEVLAEHVAAMPEGDVKPEARETVATRCREAQLGIEVEAYPLGARLFAGDPEEMAALWVKWWRLWRAQVA
ncbi:CHAD domain-containing protein [Gemmobacter nanjingensis]|uniref:CHAD domain-containing protein n=1 Tax=Gemmobacter nanjingensis TaxID=488454 RepID=A0ABQ3FDB7_9RHOB|nr:CHAD domain-containing protein [Gemmobacter nanjingensis]GHC19065.1 CHAD domain-containing protein [Gemmobacter nanjingensis]